MSNHLAIATVTAALQRVLNTAVMNDVNGATATALRPDASAGGLPAKGVNVFLYQVSPNGALRNADLPTRNGAGNAINRPCAAIDLHYLLTFYGEGASLDAQLVMGSVARQLHSVPFLTRDTIQDAVNANAWLTGSNLMNQIELVKLTPTALSLEDLSKLWSILLQTVYAPSMTYVASVVLLDADVPARQSFPVRSVGPFARTMPSAHIDRVEPQTVPHAVPASVTLVGRGLLGPDRRYMFSGLDGTLLTTPSSDTRAVVELPASLPAGPVVASIRDEAPLGPDHGGFTSNSVVFMHLPAVTAQTFESEAGPPPDRRLVVTIAPAPGQRQKIELVLNDTTSGDSYAVPARPRRRDGDPAVFTVLLVPAGTYVYRVRVDGAESPLETDTTNPDPAHQPYVGPTLVLP